MFWILKRNPGFVFFSLIILLISGCSTTNHGPIATMAYHDITSKYNAHFNVKEKLKATLKSVQEAHKDNMDKVLPVYDFTNPTETSSYGSDLDDIIARSTQAVQLHAPSNWSDDHFLLIGKAAYLKGDYEKAAASFKYITTEYKDGVDYVRVMKATKGKSVKAVKHKLKKKKKTKPQITDNKDGTKTIVKEDNRPERTLIIHDPARSEALIWLISTYIRMKKFNEANAVITYVRNDDKFYKNYDRLLDLTEADLLITSRNYTAAIPLLEKYLLNTRKKREKTRPAFALGQLYELNGDFNRALSSYKSVLKTSPREELDFHAQLKMAKIGRKTGGVAETKKLLAKLQKDAKFKDYRDQTWYELALIQLEENDRTSALSSLKKSISFSLENEEQKAESYLLIARILYEDQLFKPAKFYYDSTLTVLKKDDLRYSEIQDRSNVLKRMIDQLDIIEEEDSLLQLASLSKEKQRQVVQRIIEEKEKLKEEEKAQGGKADAGASRTDMGAGRQDNLMQSQRSNTSVSGNAWYFYNQTTRSAGYNQFINKWGRRKWEPNWRRKDKSTVINTDEETEEKINEEEKEGEEKPENGKTLTEEELMLEKIPNTEEKKAKAAERKAEAMYTLGVIYKDDLNSPPKAHKTFTSLNSSYPNHKLKLETLYQLYLLARLAGNSEGAESTKGQIIVDFPESRIARFLQDPNYLNELTEKENRLSRYYDDTYRDYEAGKMAAVGRKCLNADSLFKPNPLRWKFELLYALALAKENYLELYTQRLQKIIQVCSEPDIKTQAQQLLNDLNKSTLPMVDLSKNTALRDSLDLVFLPKGKKDSVLQNQILQSGPNAEELIKTIENRTAFRDSVKTIVTDSVKKETPFYSYYRYTESEPHLFVMLLQNTQASTLQITAQLNKLNSEQFADSRLTVKPIILDQNIRLIVVRELKSKQDAMNYYREATQDSLLRSSSNTSVVYMSKSNYDLFFGRKDIAEYLRFFNRYKDSIGLNPLPVILTPEDSAKAVKTLPANKLAEKPVEKKQDSQTKPKENKNKTVVTAPKDSVSPTATPKETVNGAAGADTIKSTVAEPEIPAVFVFSENETHQLVVRFKKPEQNPAELQSALSAFNNEVYASTRLTTKTVILDAETKIIFVKSFPNAAMAKEYLSRLQQTATVQEKVNATTMDVFVISQANYLKLISNKLFDGYMAFFRKHYR